MPPIGGSTIFPSRRPALADPLWRLPDVERSDAAHPMNPVACNGASQAILDAGCLARLLSEMAPEAALRAYQAERLPKTAAVVRSKRVGGPERLLDVVAERAPPMGLPAWRR